MTPHEATVTAQSDAAVIAASLTHPTEFAEIFDRHFRTIHRYVARRVRDPRRDRPVRPQRRRAGAQLQNGAPPAEN
jgi:hypothetical protein